MKARFLSIAARELDESIDYYESQVPGLGKRLRDDVKKTLDRIRQSPSAWRRTAMACADVARRIFHMASFTQSRRTRLSWLPSSICIEIPSIGVGDYVNDDESEGR